MEPKQINEQLKLLQPLQQYTHEYAIVLKPVEANQGCVSLWVLPGLTIPPFGLYL